MKWAIASGLCMCLMGCMGAGDDGAGSAPKTAAAPQETAAEQVATTEAPSAMLAPKAPAVAVAAAGNLKPFSSKLEVTEAGVIENMSASFDPNKALALKAFRTRLGVQQ